MIIEIPTKAHVDFSSQNDKNRRDMSTVLNYQDKESDIIKLTNLDGITVNRKSLNDNELSINEFIDDELDKKLFQNLIKNCKNNSRFPFKILLKFLQNMIKFKY